VIPASDEAPARSTGRSMRRFLGGGALIALLTMVTISTAVFEGVSTIADVLGKGHLITSAYLTPAGPGQAQTILLIGSDKRALSKSLADRNSPPHTDTIILIRLDSDLGLVSVMSVPRDLLVPSFTFRGVTYHDQKINYAYTVGNVYGSKVTDGDNLTLRVVEKALDRDSVLCTHGDVIAELLDHFGRHGIKLRDHRMEKGSIWVLDVRDGAVDSTRYVPPPKAS
jgi:hypothetical protein